MLHIVPMACRCAWHQLCETWPKRFRAMPPFTKFLYFFITCGKAGIGGIPITFSNSSSIRSVVLSFVNFLCLFFAEFCQFSVSFLCRVLLIFCVFSLQSKRREEDWDIDSVVEAWYSPGRGAVKWMVSARSDQWRLR